ncbi:MAG: hypothetical protein ACTSSP_00750 [Candidatus Asgardarchaeia archaeon]
MGKKLAYEYVEQYFKEHGCKLLEKEYKNCKVKMKYRCECGNINKINFDNFKQGRRCQNCANKQLRKDRQFSFQYVYSYFKKQGCELLEKKYINSHTKMRYRCKCGNISGIRLANFKLGERCTKCGGSEKFTFEYVYNYFKEQDCELLEKGYINSRTKIKYKCSCKNISTTKFYHFKNGHRCNKCGVERTTGKNNYNYNSNLTNEDRILNRKLPGYEEWRKKVYKRDNYICQKCKNKKDKNNKYKKINAHHIRGYADNKKLRTKVSNGRVLCQECHNGFHKTYGKRNNNKQQLNEFLNKKTITSDM